MTFEPPLANERGFFNESEPKINLKTTDRYEDQNANLCRPQRL